MQVLIAVDSFKGSMSSQKAGEAVAAGLKKACPDAGFKIIPIADGGEGTTEALVEAGGGTYLSFMATHPLGAKKVAAKIGLREDKTAIAEMAAASGLTLLAKEERNPFITTTRGTGELVKFALDNGAKKILLGIGGSATNDGGAGFAQALGVKLLNKEGNELSPGGQDLINLAKIDVSGLDPRLKEVAVTVICDVNNPLCGELGASAVFGPQKGATPPMVAELDQALAHFAQVVKDQLNIDAKDMPGAGAAGGLGYGLKVFANAEFKSGIDAVLDFVNFDAELQKCDLVITGEGRVDAQSAYGKAPQGVGERAKKQGKSVIAVAGSAAQGAEALYNCGIKAIVPIVTLPPGKVEIDYAIENGFELIAELSERMFRLIEIGKGL
ncbi:MAG: glycerate kinase [Sporomusaceae bacterium]|jgi:glycerate kinase|nr:glycerate kinase [Sporomusaceae bacterium]